jgi:adenosylcobinamide kinase/adenosylcobinamide-phosphate guanylyltransferase
LDLPAALEKADNGFVLVDCLTLWLSNLMLAELDWEKALAQLIAVLAIRRAQDIVLVSNETGLGIVPDTPLGRRFRDAQGITNQRVARVADTVILTVAGIPMAVKGSLPARPLQPSE